METTIQVRRPWNKGLIVGQKRPLLPRQVWSIRVRLEMTASARDLALFNLAIDSKLRASDLVRLKVEDVCSGRVVRDRGVVIQKKTGRPVQFEITEVTRQSVDYFMLHKRAFDPQTGLNRYDDESLIRAREAMILGVQIFNSAALKFKSEVFCVLSNIAWTYLLGARIEGNEVRIETSVDSGSVTRLWILRLLDGLCYVAELLLEKLSHRL